MSDCSFQAGDEVRVTVGGFSGIYGKVSEARNGIATVVVRIEDREIVIKISCNQLEKLNR